MKIFVLLFNILYFVNQLLPGNKISLKRLGESRVPETLWEYNTKRKITVTYALKMGLLGNLEDPLAET
jgi:hypothetical protein